MGVDYYNCSLCDEVFADCGPNGFCGECEGWMCGQCHDNMTEKYGYVDADSEAAEDYGECTSMTCDKCAGEVIDEYEFRAFVISLTGKTEEQLEDDFRKMKRGDK